MWDDVRPFLRFVPAHEVEAAAVALVCVGPLAVPSGLQISLCGLPAAALWLGQERQCARLVAIHEVLEFVNLDRGLLLGTLAVAAVHTATAARPRDRRPPCMCCRGFLIRTRFEFGRWGAL